MKLNTRKLRAGMHKGRFRTSGAGGYLRERRIAYASQQGNVERPDSERDCEGDGDGEDVVMEMMVMVMMVVTGSCRPRPLLHRDRRFLSGVTVVSQWYHSGETALKHVPHQIKAQRAGIIGKRAERDQ
jgi:hypothetical protein